MEKSCDVEASSGVVSRQVNADGIGQICDVVSGSRSILANDADRNTLRRYDSGGMRLIFETVFPRLLCVFLLGTVVPVAAADAQSLSRFDRLSIALSAAEDEDRADFARDALTELYAVYSAESDLARRDQRGAVADRQADRQWANSVDAFSRRLVDALDWIDSGAGVVVNYQGAATELWLPEADIRVLLEHPRQAQQGAYEQQVLASFCRRRRCDLLLVPDQSGLGLSGTRQAIPQHGGSVVLAWSFSLAGPACGSRGLTLQFPAGRSVDGVRQPCRELHHELATLIDGMRWHQRRGVVVDWERLALSPLTGRPGHQLRLNQAGDVLLLEAPLLAASQDLLNSLTGWLQQRVEHDEGELILEVEQWPWGAP